ncbi:MAG TPA: PqqD family protein [Burkholderiales bacterium]|nr:PqqD family protein [Burkholderiales bacterium]HZE26744.1 PqqD family protein [Terriglobales bacterium]
MTIPVKRRDGLILRKVQQDLLLLDTEFNQIHQLNETASFIWENWEQVPDPIGIARLLAQKFDVDEQMVLNDVSAIVGRLQELNLLVR